MLPVDAAVLWWQQDGVADIGNRVKHEQQRRGAHSPASQDAFCRQSCALDGILKVDVSTSSLQRTTAGTPTRPSFWCCAKPKETHTASPTRPRFKMCTSQGRSNLACPAVAWGWRGRTIQVH